MVTQRIKEDIDEYNIRTYDGGHRTHLGASLIGHSCKRYLWYVFRWTFREQDEKRSNYARKLRLFNRGHREEARFIEWLEGIGLKIWYENRDGLHYHAESDSYVVYEPGEEIDPLCEPITQDNPMYTRHVARAKADGIEFPQYRVSSVMGHFGGSLDGIAVLPERYGIEEPVLLEFKTNGTGSTFDKLGDSGMVIAKPQHFAQTSTYGSDPNYRFRYVLYLNINKNDDSLHVELAKLDWKLGDQMRQKAEQIVLTQTPPPRLSDNPTYRECSWCPVKTVCHQGGIPEKNCRSCKHALPVENAQWFCDVHKDIIPKEFIPQACPSYIPITALTQNA